MRNKFKYFVLALAGCLITSCSVMDEGSCNDSDSFSHKVTFTLALDEPAASRNTWGDAYDNQIGDHFENRILLDQLQVAVYDTNNAKIGDVANLIYWPTNEQATEYKFMGDLTELALQAGSTYRIHVLANVPDSEGALDALSYEVAHLNTSSGAIPMWGVKQVTLTLTDLQDIGTISMLRAAAKIEVIMADLLDYRFDQANLNYYNQSGYVLPTGWDLATETVELNREGSLRELRSLKSEGQLLTLLESGKRAVIYLPEYNNTLFTEYEAKISLSVTSTSDANTSLTFDNAIQFRNYTDGAANGDPYNIVRNHIYRYYITAVRDSGVELSYEVADWSRTDDWEWVQDFSYPTYHNPVLPDAAIRDHNPDNDIYPDRPTMKYTAPNTHGTVATTEGAFSCWFQLTAPINQQWRPVLREGATECEIQVYDDSTPQQLLYTTEDSVTIPELKDGSRLVAYAGWYNIKIIPTNHEYTGTVSFGITYTQAWMGVGGTRYLLINGEGDSIIWPNSGNEARIITITQVQ